MNETCSTCVHRFGDYCRVKGERTSDDDTCASFQGETLVSMAERFEALRRAVDEEEREQ